MSEQLDAKLFNATEFDTTLAHDAKAIRHYRKALQDAHRELRDLFDAGRSATELVQMYSLVIDALLQRAWLAFFPTDDKYIALVAVGGYGRGELHPYSDIDLLLLLDKSPKHYKDRIIGFTTFLWDIGLQVGHSVRTLKECLVEAKQDITVATTLQEARLLCGPEQLFEKHRKQCGPNKIWPSKQFFAEKLREQQLRHQKFNDTAYNLEPNIKEGPGGLRDIQNIGWIAKRHFGADTLHDLVEHQFLTEEEYQALHEGQAFLWQIRYGLHILAGRREDRLLFDYQRTLAARFGYQDDNKSQGVEKFMKQYYRTVMELSRLNEMLLQLFHEEILEKNSSRKPVELNKRFQASKGYLEAVHDNIFKQYPFALLEVFLLMAQHPELKGVRANTIRLIRSHRYLIDANFREDLRCRSLFMEILRQSHGVTHELRRMNRYGILAAYLPVFGNIVGQMQHDLFHVYTVDEHILMVIRNLRRFTVESHKDEFPLCSAVMKEIPKQELLILAAMFHDIAKGRGGDHSELGEAEAMAFCAQHQLSDYDSRLVSWLVKYHLIMSTTAQRKDISDPDVVHEFATLVGDRNHLNYLYLLTVADIRATSPTVWNSWKDALLRELYTTTLAALRRGLDHPVLESENIADTKHIASDKLRAAGVDIDAVQQLWARFDDEYFLRYNANELAWHAEGILHTRAEDLPLLLIRHAAIRGGTEIFIYHRAHDRLFAHVTGTLEQLGLTIADARILRSRDGYTLDTYIALDESGLPVTDAHRLSEMLVRLKKRLRDPVSELAKPSQHLPRQTKAFTVQTNVRFWLDENNRRTAMQVTTRDRPGLLSRIARAFLDCDIELQNAKIATFGERAEDIFYITDTAMQPLEQESQFECLREAIKTHLGEQN